MKGESAVGNQQSYSAKINDKRFIQKILLLSENGVAREDPRLGGSCTVESEVRSAGPHRCNDV